MFPKRNSRTSTTSRARLSPVVILSPLLALAPMIAGGESRGYVISWFATATNAVDFKANCPENRNGKAIDWEIRDLIATGYTPQQAKDIVASTVEVSVLPPDIMRKVETRAIVNGKHVSIYNYPDAVPDPNIETVSGKYAYGFDLGGNPDNKFIDPDTHERVDNQLWRAVGCTETFHAVPPVMPYPEGENWMNEVDLFPATALQISGADLTRDGKVVVTLSLTTQHLERDANGGILKNVSYIVDPSPRSYKVLQGEIKNGVLTIKPDSVRLEGTIYREIALRDGHMRIQQQGNELIGYWGGYIPWKPFVFVYTGGPDWGADAVGLYHSLKRLADASPDPLTGQNTEISSTFRMEAVPAYLTKPDGTVLAEPMSVPALGSRHN
jgi:hypothetical protein